MQQLILDPEGVFYYNSGRFNFVDPTTGVVFEPSVRVKTKPTEWMLGQPVLVLDEQVTAAPQVPETSPVPDAPQVPQTPEAPASKAK